MRSSSRDDPDPVRRLAHETRDGSGVVLVPQQRYGLTAGIGGRLAPVARIESLGERQQRGGAIENEITRRGKAQTMSRSGFTISSRTSRQLGSRTHEAGSD
jgi:hypothetical protein